MSKDYSEDALVQTTIAEQFETELGWELLDGFPEEETGSLDRPMGRASHRSVILPRHLKAALRRLNPDVPGRYLDEAMEVIQSSSAAKTRDQINQEKYQIYRNGLVLDLPDGRGGFEPRTLRIFDFDQPEENHFLVVREFWVRGRMGHHRRADLVGFVNGIPLLFMECKATHKALEVAFNRNLKDYKDTIPELMHHNALVVLSNGIEAKAGTVTSRFKHFHEWKRLEEKDRGRVHTETLMRGMCSKRAFMDLFENFILFDTSGAKPVKLLARNHQYLGVNLAMEAVLAREARQGRLGVFWHTQGSGKSYSMVFLAQKILRKIGGHFTFLVLTDRQELDKQIHGTFVSTGAVSGKAQVRAASGDHLKRLLADENHRYVFSLIHKFNEDGPEPYSSRGDIIVFSDEAHRTQYGKLARNMRKALPKASFVGFTGTPLMGTVEDQVTKEVFGDYVSMYDFQRSVEDGSTVRLYYESRGEKLGLANLDLNQKVAEALEKARLDPDQEAKLQRELAREYPILTSTKRLQALAEDCVNHYTANWETGKAMLVCIDKLTCVRMFDLIEPLWKQKIAKQAALVEAAEDEQEQLDCQRKLDWLTGTRRYVVVSDSQNEVDLFRAEDMDIGPHRKRISDGEVNEKGERMDLEDAFKDPDHPFRFAIVCAMWLTGFDVPTLATLYLDKPMKSHTLMQTIARANRVAEGKDNGTIVDYNGLLKSLRQALAVYAANAEGTAGAGGEARPAGDRDEQIQELRNAVQACREHLAGIGFDMDCLVDAKVKYDRLNALLRAEEALYASGETKAKYEVLARDVFRKAKPLVSEKAVRTLWPAHDAIEAVYKRIQDNREAADVSDILRQLREIVDERVVLRPDSAAETPEPFDISGIDFDRLRKEFEHSTRKNTALHCLESRVAQVLAHMIQKNPARVDFQKRYQTILDTYNREKDRATIEQTFEALTKLIEDLSQEERRAVREGLSEEQQAVFDLMVKAELKPKERERVKDMAKSLLNALREQLANMDHWTEKATTKAQVRQFIHDFLVNDQREWPEAYAQEEVEGFTQQVYDYVLQQFGSAPEGSFGVA